MTNVAVLMLLTLLSGSSMAGDDPEAVVRAFIRAAYSHDKAQFEGLVFPKTRASVLLNSEPVAKERIEEIETEVRDLRIEQLQPFRQRGSVVKRGAGDVYPEGTTTRYSTAFEGNLTVISVVKRDGRWLVDVRWWLKLIEMSQREEKPDEKELAVKTFLLNLLRLDRHAVSENLVPGADIDLVFKGAPRVPEPSDVLPSLAIEMPLVEAEADEVYPLPSGRLVRSGARGEETVLVGLFGQSEMVFQLRRISGKWRVVPEAYYALINR